MPHLAPDRLFLDFQAAVAGRYSLERELGRGGMGVVYLAREVRLDRPVAIKLLPPSKTSDPKLRERFLREARTAAKLSHPNIIPIHAVEEIGEFVFFAMAYIEGETLTERVRRRGGVFCAVRGRRAWGGERRGGVWGKRVPGPAPPLASVAPGVPRRIAQAIDHCLSKDRDDRPEGTSVLADQFSRALEQRRELPLALRVFVKRGARFDDAGALLYPFVLLGAVVAASPILSVAVGYGLFAAGITLVPAAVLIQRARRLLKAGFDHGDLEVAFKAELDRDREERGGRWLGPSWLERISKAIGLGGFIFAGLHLTIIPLLAGVIMPQGVVLGLGVGLWGMTGALILLQ